MFFLSFLNIPKIPEVIDPNATIPRKIVFIRNNTPPILINQPIIGILYIH